MKRLLLPVLAATALATGCYAQGDVGTGYSYGYASASGPDLYYMSPGVSVVAYADQPTFYSDNYYWMYGNDGLWYRSSYYGGGWAVSYDVPNRVRTINRPGSYTRFTPGQGWTRVGGSGRARYNTNQGTPAYAGRTYQAPAGRSYQAPAGRSTYNPPARANGGVYTTPRGNGGGPTVRDHRHR